jgi:hypothetical protein
VQLFFTCLLYFTSFGAIFALFTSVASIVIWLVLWLIAEPETEASRTTQFRPHDLAHLKRAGQ